MEEPIEIGVLDLRVCEDELEMPGAVLFRPYFLCLLANALLKAGNAADARAQLNEAFAVAADTGEKWCTVKLEQLRDKLVDSAT